MKICSMCQNQVSDNHNTCPHCGGSNLQYIPEQHMNNTPISYQNPEYENQMVGQDYQQHMMNQPINVKETSVKDIVGAVFCSIGLYYCLNIIFIILNGFQKFYDELLKNPTISEQASDYAGNATFWAFSVTFVPIICGLVAFFIGLSGRKKGKTGINTYNFIGGIINFAVSLVAIIYIYNFFK